MIQIALLTYFLISFGFCLGLVNDLLEDNVIHKIACVFAFILSPIIFPIMLGAGIYKKLFK